MSAHIEFLVQKNFLTIANDFYTDIYVNLVPHSIPFLNSTTDRVWNLDNKSDLKDLGFPNGIHSKRTDRYAHYSICTHALIEFSTSAIAKELVQLQECNDFFVDSGKKVDYLIIVVDNIGRERKLFDIDAKKNLLLNGNGKPIYLNCKQGKKEVFCFTEEKAHNTHVLR